jgi:hypothetical protein
MRAKQLKRIVLTIVLSLLCTPGIYAEPFSVDLSLYEGKDEIKQTFRQTLPDGKEITSVVHIYQSHEDGRNCIVSETDSEVLYVRSCVGLEKGTAVSTHIVEREYDEAEYRIIYTQEKVTVEERTKKGKIREKTFDNNRVLDGYIITFLLSAIPYEKLNNKPEDFNFLNHKDQSLISVTIELIDSRERYSLGGQTVEAVHYRTKVHNFLISLFTSPDHFYYGRRGQAPVMLKYEGSDPSNIRERIRFELSPDSYRESSRIFTEAQDN